MWLRHTICALWVGHGGLGRSIIVPHNAGGGVAWLAVGVWVQGQFKSGLDASFGGSIRPWPHPDIVHLVFTIARRQTDCLSRIATIADRCSSLKTRKKDKQWH